MRASELAERLADFIERYGDPRIGDEDGRELTHVVHKLGSGLPLKDSDYIELRFAFLE